MSSSAEFAAPSVVGGPTAKTVDIKSFIDEQPISAFQWLLVALCFLVVVADGMDVAIMGFVTPSILQEWDISRPAFGIVISAAPFGLVVGERTIAARPGPRLAVALAVGGAVRERPSGRRHRALVRHRAPRPGPPADGPARTVTVPVNGRRSPA